ncbi:hypothetical protein [Streptomyces sp. NPDC048442]|uniref:RNA recognition motif domain-containing protein n=1 Tax=Streptomyces sp. NPDC048442 TaxID=3154823 RepID=UPI00341D0D6C
MIYGWGLPRTETSRLDLMDFGRNAKAPQFGRFGTLNVRYGKAKKGQPPRLRNVLSVMGWAVGSVEDYVENVRPRFGFPDFGQVLESIVMRDRETNTSRGFGFVTFSSSPEAEAAINGLNGQELDGNLITVSAAASRPTGGGGRLQGQQLEI